MKKSIIAAVAGISALGLTALSAQAAVNKTTCPMSICNMNPAMSFFQDSFNSAGPGSSATTYVKTTTDGSQIVIVAPGLTKKDFKVELKGNILTVTGENQIDSKTKKPVDDIITNNFNFTYTVSKDVNNDKITSDYKEGVLTINLPIDKEKVKEETKSIEIK